MTKTEFNANLRKSVLRESTKQILTLLLEATENGAMTETSTENFGGHFGFSIKIKRYPDFSKKMTAIAESHFDNMPDEPDDCPFANNQDEENND